MVDVGVEPRNPANISWVETPSIRSIVDNFLDFAERGKCAT
jgi:hypothetical protein